MYFKILKKDLKRKKTMNILLLLFVILATTFIASSVNNLLLAINGTDYFIEQAGIKDYLIVTMRAGVNADDENEQIIKDFLKNEPEVKAYTIDDIVYLSKSNINLENEKTIEVTSPIIVGSYKTRQQKFFDMDNREIKAMEDGTIYVSPGCMEDNEISDGDTIIISTRDGYEKKFKVAGGFKDVVFGSEQMGATRFVISENDFHDMLENGGFPCGGIFSVETGDFDKFVSHYNDLNCNATFACGKSLIKQSYLMDLVIAAVMLLISICLIMIAAVMIRFVILFAVNEDYREIGIMKAIGLSDRGIRGLYTTKYFVIAAVGAVIGFFISIPFGNMLVKQVTKTILIRNDNSSIMLQIMLSVFVALIITLIAYAGTGKIRKNTPMDAIRSGNSGERFKRKGMLKLNVSKMKTTTFLACNDVINELKKYMTLLVTGIVGIWLVVMPANTVNTLRSDRIARWFQIQECDLWIVDDEVISDCVLLGTREAFEAYVEEVKDNLTANGINVDKAYCEIMFLNLKITKDDKSCKSIAYSGVGTDMNNYMYEKGMAPKYENEVALSHITAKAIDADIGDTVYIGEKELIVSAIFQTMTNMGEGIRLHPDTELDYSLSSGCWGVQVVLGDGYKKADKEKIIEDVKGLYSNARVQDTSGFMDSNLGGISDRLADLKILMLVIVMVIIVMVVVLMQKMFLIRESGQMAMLKTMGFSNGNIIAWQTKRISLVLFIGIVLGTVTGTTFSQITSGQVFKIMGASRIEFVINPIEIYVIYPLAIFIVTVLICMLTMLKVRRINIYHMNQSE